MRFIPLCLILALAGCDIEKAARLEKKNKNLRTELDPRRHEFVRSVWADCFE
jgi:hypothetical protein